MKSKNAWTVGNALAKTAIALLFAAILYVASSGPVIAIAFWTEHIRGCERVVEIYRPLFRACPQLMMPYLNHFGVSDVEMFFVLQEPKRSIR